MSKWPIFSGHASNKMASTMEALFGKPVRVGISVLVKTSSLVTYFFNIDKATNPNNTLEDWEFIVQFSDRVNLDPEG